MTMVSGWECLPRTAEQGAGGSDAAEGEALALRGHQMASPGLPAEWHPFKGLRSRGLGSLPGNCLAVATFPSFLSFCSLTSEEESDSEDTREAFKRAIPLGI